MCFDSAFQLIQVNEQLSAFEKQLSDLTVEFSLAVIYRRSQTTVTTKNTGQKSKIEIDVSGLPDNLFYCSNSENASDQESRVVEDIESNIIAGNQNDVVLSEEHIERGNDVSPLECSAKIELENLLAFPNQTSVDEENVKPEITGGSCDSVAGNNICSACPGNTEDDAHSLMGSNIVIEMKEQLSNDIDLAEFESDPLSLTEDQPKKIPQITRNRILSSQPLRPGNIEVAKSRLSKLVTNSSICKRRVSKSRLPNLLKSDGSDPLRLTKDQPKKIRKSTKNRTQSSQSGNIAVAKSQLSKVDGNPSICKKKVNKRLSSKLSKSEVSNHSQKPLLNHSDGRNKITDRFKIQRRSKKDESHSHSFQCEFCNKIFTTKRKQQDHIRTHTGERPYQCPFCSKAFKQNAHLAVHKRIHTGERPHKCFYCPKTFNSSSNKRTHQVSHHGDSR